MAYAEICKIRYLRSFQTLLQQIEEKQDASGREEIKVFAYGFNSSNILSN